MNRAIRFLLLSCLITISAGFTESPLAAQQGSFPGSSTGAQTGSPNTFTAPQTFSADSTFRGPNPRVYATAFGARPVLNGAIPTTPCSISLVSPAIANCTSAANFRVKDGISFQFAGPQQSLPTPAAPTVTPSCASGLTGLGFAVPITGGSLTNSYSIAQRDTGQGYSAASADGTTTTAFPLGATSVTVTGTVNSILNTFSSTVSPNNNGLAVGCMVQISGSNDDKEFAGWKIISALPDGTHVNWTSGVDVTYGLTQASATGGVMKWWISNHLTYGAGSGGGQQHFIFGRTAGSETIIGESLINTLAFPDAPYLSWDDYGTTMMASFPVPWFAPATPPGSAQPDTLTTTISAINGNQLTLANGASTATVSQTARFDNAPNIAACVAASSTFSSGGGGNCYIPPFVEQGGGGPNCYSTSSYLQITASILEVGAPLCLGDTLQFSGGRIIGDDSSAIRLVSINFGYESHIPINTTGANPGIWLKNAAGMHNLTMQNFGNGSVMVFDAQLTSTGTPQIFEDMNWVSGTGSVDHMTLQFLDYHDPNFGGFGGLCIKCAFTTNMPLVNGSTATPLWASKFSQEWNWFGLTGSGRGFALIPGNALFSTMNMGTEWNGGLMPLLTVIQPRAGNVGGYLTINSAELDTMAQAVLANLSPSIGTFGGPVNIWQSNQPSSNQALITGSSFAGSVRVHGYAGPDPTTIGHNRHLCVEDAANYQSGFGAGCSEFGLTSTLLSKAIPTISSGFGTSPAVVNPNGSGFFQVNVGTGGAASSGVIATNFTAAHNWNCGVANLTAHAGNRADDTVQTASTATTITVQNQTKSTGAAVSWAASDILQLSCTAN